MPCRCDYLEPDAREIESRRVATLFCYLSNALTQVPPAWVVEAARDGYGNPTPADELTAMLCALCQTVTDAGEADRFIYKARDPQARKLADWWDEHQEADRKREAEERDAAKQERIRKGALAKLSPAERAALGL